MVTVTAMVAGAVVRRKMSDGQYHVYPKEDIFLHDITSLECLCGPKVEWVDGAYVVVHNSMDGREGREADE